MSRQAGIKNNDETKTTKKVIIESGQSREQAGRETCREAEKQSGRRIEEQEAAGMHNIDQGTLYAA